MDNENWEYQYDINDSIARVIKMLNHMLDLLFIWDIILTIVLIFIIVYILR